MQTVQTARWLLGFIWIYHGFFPKLLHVAPTEKAMTATLGFSPEISLLITRAAGVSEMIIGILIIVFYKRRWLIGMNMLMLAGLLVFVAVQMPWLLIEAFNPVTTNLAMMGLSVVLLAADKTECAASTPINFYREKNNEKH